MKKIINGRKYDTDTATEIYKWSNDYGMSNFNYEIEYLYIKKSGEYFIHGRGGAMSKYSKRSDGNCTCGGEDIIPLHGAEAFNWGSAKMPVEKFEDHFGEVAE
jgi:hypothetical protein